ncbi:uncharacterized protein LOC125663538 isoform X2 [Ostrea edulis]|uniref:uncharacterized protein LOC125663538 isoform X2 n=1 Tax=Ostrea edulis TaxID=37623 RepID=UPI0024AF7716|nr:uncharacterized protein LOC125663538 isoform X2 [Ostrea edulis]
MDYFHCLVLQGVIGINKMLLAQQSGICSNTTGEVVCCENYFLTGNLCEVCPLGTFGKNCSFPCPNGTYGKLCTGTCDCSPCHKVHGCLKNQDSKPRTVDYDWWTIVSSVAGSFSICVIVGIVIYCRLRHVNVSSKSYYPGNRETSYRNGAIKKQNNIQNSHLIDDNCRLENPVELRNWNQRNNSFFNCRRNVSDCTISISNQQSKPQSSVSRTPNVPDHELEIYDILSLKCQTARDLRTDSFFMPVYNKLTRSVNHCDVAETKCRDSFLYPKHPLREDAEYYKLTKQ